MGECGLSVCSVWTTALARECGYIGSNHRFVRSADWFIAIALILYSVWLCFCMMYVMPYKLQYTGTGCVQTLQATPFETRLQMSIEQFAWMKATSFGSTIQYQSLPYKPINSCLRALLYRVSEWVCVVSVHFSITIVSFAANYNIIVFPMCFSVRLHPLQTTTYTAHTSYTVI